VFWRAANVAPSGYLIADGSLVSTATYANLFAIIGYTYGGTGSGFALPDLRGQFIRGIDNGRGVDPSRGFGTTQTDAFQGHYHVPLTNQTTFWGDASGGPQQGRPTGGGGYYLNRTTGSPVSDGSNGIPRTASETRPINIALLPIIKY
jgi:phage-related tail fiber protein